MLRAPVRIVGFFSFLTRIGLEDAIDLVGDEVSNDRIATQTPEYCGKMMSNQSGDSVDTKTFLY